MQIKKNFFSGSVLILSLWMVALLSTIVITLGYGIRQKVSLVVRLEEKRRLSCLIDAGIRKAIDFLKKQECVGYIGLNDKLINNPLDFKDMDFGQDRVSFANSVWDDVEKDFINCYGLIDESRKLNINTTTLPTLKRFFILLGLDELKADEIASSVIDWRDTDDLLSSPNSAEDTYYRFLESAYEAKDSNFEILEELLLVRGMDRDIFFKAKDYLTVYGNGRVNINTTSRIVLLALGLSEDLVDKIITFRAGKDGALGTADDNVFKNIEEIIPRLSKNFELNSIEIEQMNSVAERYLTVDSDFFTIKATAQPKGTERKLTVTAVVDKSGKILRWEES
ncbi:MAG: general secretion pathway protein GspK [Candidatus Omnitrophica bacterium]|nr:general secretion pathway protein GspK [Candidatus Omnitrophota bacterium]